jgi:four helix bundle protein
MPRDFKKIKAWQHADDLAVLVYSKTKSFPVEELYGITSQLRRAAVSIPANVAEGAGREHKKEYFHFLNIARGSIVEMEYLLHFSKRVGYLKKDEYNQLEELRKETAKTLQGLMNSVKKDTEKIKSFS